MPPLSRFRAWLNPDQSTSNEPDPWAAIAQPPLRDGPPRIVVGLGNPGPHYARTRHNLGFMVIDELVRRTNAGPPKSRHKAAIWETRLGDQRLILVKPQTFMNASGEAVSPILQWYKAELDDLLIIVDDLDQPFAQIRIRPRGGSGGHNGLKSIFAQLGSQEVGRLRIGIGRGSGETIDYVLSRFSAEQEPQLPEIISRAADTVELWLRAPMLDVMNHTNGS